jgi:hypothetical protein
MVNLIKGKKTKLTNIFCNGETENQEIRLQIWRQNDLDDIIKPKYFSGRYIDLEKFNNQLNKLIKDKSIQKIEIAYPCSEYEFNCMLIWEK